MLNDNVAAFTAYWLHSCNFFGLCSVYECIKNISTCLPVLFYITSSCTIVLQLWVIVRALSGTLCDANGLRCLETPHKVAPWCIAWKSIALWNLKLKAAHFFGRILLIQIHLLINFADESRSPKDSHLWYKPSPNDANRRVLNYWHSCSKIDNTMYYRVTVFIPCAMCHVYS